MPAKPDDWASRHVPMVAGTYVSSPMQASPDESGVAVSRSEETEVGGQVLKLLQRGFCLVLFGHGWGLK